MCNNLQSFKITFIKKLFVVKEPLIGLNKGNMIRQPEVEHFFWALRKYKMVIIISQILSIHFDR